MKGTRLTLPAATAAGIGLYVAQHMYRKTLRAQRCELDEPSIVERPAARALFAIPNAAFGLAYYGLTLAALPFSGSLLVRRGILAASAPALMLSVYLMYSLLFVTRKPCPYCWTGHAVNVALFAIAVAANRDAADEQPGAGS